MPTFAPVTHAPNLARPRYSAEVTHFMCVAIMATAVEASLAWAWFKGLEETAYILAGHVLFSAILWGYIRLMKGRTLEIYRQLLVGATMMFGFMGSGAVMIGFLMTYGLDKYFPAHFDETFDDLFDLSPEVGDAEVFRHVQHYNVVGSQLIVTDQLLDMFKFGSDVEKQNVLAVINSNYQPKFAKILRLGLQDTNNVIRIQAAAILADLEQRQQKMLLDLEKASQNSTNDADKLALAQHYDDMAHSGITDDVRRNKLYAKAARIYEDMIAAEPESAVVAKRLARVYYRMGEAQKAADVIRTFAEDLSDISLSLWYLELLFVTNNTDDLRTFARELEPLVAGNHAYPIKLQRAVQLWAI